MRDAPRTSLGSLVVWLFLLFGACVDQPLPPDPPAARLVVSWDPLSCGPPHRVALDLVDDGGDEVSKSAPCEIGSLSVDMPALGAFHGKVYAWAPDTPPDDSAAMDLSLDVSPPVTAWELEAVP